MGPERRIARFVEDLLRNRRPRRFRATPEELAAMRAAAELRAARPGADLPDLVFVDRLGRRLREELSGEPGRRTVTRRRLLLRAGTAAAAAAAGAAAGVAGDRVLGVAGGRELVPEGATWQPVMAAATLAAGRAVRFSTGAVEGFVVNQGGAYHAVSAVCTHLGCLLQESSAGLLTCPCHRSAFGLDGSVVQHELQRAPAALPWLHTRVRDGQVEVLAV